VSLEEGFINPVPRHVGIIMDGNGRWALRRGRPRVYGHRCGAEAVERVVEAAVELGVRQLTLFAFSSENWKRPRDEVRALMNLFRRFLKSQTGRLVEHGIRLRTIGRTWELPRSLRRALARAEAATRFGEKLTLCLAVNYGGRAELVDACRKIAREVAEGRTDPDQVTEEVLQRFLYQPDMPPLDLVIRTAGEMRLSNFLLWQAAYAEFYATPVFWPDFTAAHFREAVAAYRRRERRFGGLPHVCTGVDALTR